MANTDDIVKQKIQSVVPTDVLGALLKELDDLPEQIKRGQQKQKELIVQTYIDELKKVVRVNREGELRQSLGREINAIVASSKNPLELKRNLRAALARRALEVSGAQAGRVRKEIESAAKATVRATESSLPGLVAILPSATEIAQAIRESSVTRKELFVQTVAAQAENFGNVDLAATDRLARTAEALQAKAHGKNLTSPAVFFQTGAKGLQKPFAALADAALTILPKTTRDNIIESVIGRGWELSTKADELNRNFGHAIVESPLFQEVLQKGNKIFGKGQPSPVTALTNAASDIASTIFGKPPTTEDLLVLVELGIIKAEYVTGYQQLYVAGAHAKRSGLFGLVFNEAAGWGIRKGAGALAAKAGGTWFGRLMGLVAGGVGGPITAFLGAIFGGALFGKIGSFLSSLFGRRRAGAPQPWHKDWSLDGILLPLVVVLSPLALIIVLFFIMFITTTGALQEFDTGGGEEGSQHITLTKTPNPSSFPANNATSVTYTIGVKPTNQGDTLEVTEIRDEFTVLAKTGEPKISSPDISPADVAGGKEFSYTIALGQQFRDSLISNTLTVVANVAGRSGETKSVSSSVVIGNPPTECFEFSDARVPDAYGHVSSAWDNKSGVLVAIAVLAKSKPYMTHVCRTGTVTLHRVKANFGGGSVNSDSDIFLYNDGVRGMRAVLTLAHETGHIIDHRSPRGGIADQFHDQGISVREGFIRTYPNEKRESEDFAETLGVYPVYKTYVIRGSGKALKYQQEYPLHYEFARGVFGMEY